MSLTDTTQETDTAANSSVLAFPLQLAARAVDATSIVIEADLATGTLAMLSGASNIAVNITDDTTYAAAADELAKIKAVSKQIDEKRKDITKPLDDEKKRVMDLVRPVTEALAGVEVALKNGLLEYTSEQERKAQLAAAAAAERQRKDSEKLETQADKAEAAGKVERADALREQASTAVFAAPAPSITATPKVTGLSTRKIYSAEVTSLTELATAAIARHLVEFAAGDANKLLQHLTSQAFKGVPLRAITADDKFLGQQATSQKESLEYPGVKVVVSTGLASRAKKA